MACRESGTICGMRIFAPCPEKRTFSIVSCMAGMIRFFSEINLTPAGKARFTGANKQVENEHYQQRWRKYARRKPPGLRPCESVSLKGLSKGLILRIFATGRDRRWSLYYRTEMILNQTTALAGCAGKTRYASENIFTLTY